MDGSSLSLILIPVVVVISLAAWLIMVAYTANHPAWKHGPASTQDAPATTLPGDGISRPRAEIPRPVRQPAQTRPTVIAGIPTAEPSIAQR